MLPRLRRRCVRACIEDYARRLTPCRLVLSRTGRDLSNNKLTGSIPLVLGNNTVLTYMCVGWPRVAFRLCMHSCGSALLTPPHGWHADSDLSYNRLTGVPDNLGNVKAVTVCVCPLSTSAAHRAHNFSRLMTRFYDCHTRRRLQNNLLSGTIPASWGGNLSTSVTYLCVRPSAHAGVRRAVGQSCCSCSCSCSSFVVLTRCTDAACDTQ
jgi:hypothetical protein